MERIRQAGVVLALATVWLVAPLAAAFAADEEIQVYMDEIGKLKKLSLDVHVNNVIDGRNVPSYPGEQLSQGRTRITPEFGYAISNAFELGAYLPLIDLSRSGDLSVDGVKLRLKYVAPKVEGQAWVWGQSRARLRQSCPRREPLERRTQGHTWLEVGQVDARDQRQHRLQGVRPGAGADRTADRQQDRLCDQPDGLDRVREL